MTLKLEAEPGETIEKCFFKAIDVTRILNIYTEFNFNGVRCMCKPFGSYLKGVDEYHEALKDKRSNKFALAS